MLKSVRVWFKKDGSLKYASHLDLARLMARILKITRLPVWYTEGFNPRLYMTFAMPLSLGVSGEAECMEIRLTDEVDFLEIAKRLNEKLPTDIRVTHVAEPLYKFEEIAFASYEMVLTDEKDSLFSDKLRRLLERDSIIILKHGKKGDKEVDIKPHFEKAQWLEHTNSSVKLSLVLPCSVSGSINPSLLLEALKKYEAAEPYAQIVRKGLLTEKLVDFQ